MCNVFLLFSMSLHTCILLEEGTICRRKCEYEYLRRKPKPTELTGFSTLRLYQYWLMSGASSARRWIHFTRIIHLCTLCRTMSSRSSGQSWHITSPTSNFRLRRVLPGRCQHRCTLVGQYASALVARNLLKWLSCKHQRLRQGLRK